MFNSTILDVAIGLIFVYLLLALLCTTVNEMIASWRKRRAKKLEEGIRVLLGDGPTGGLTDELYKHPLVRSLCRKESEKPSYIPARTFARALQDTVTQQRSAASSESRGAGTPRRMSAHLERSLPMLEDSKLSADARRERVETWFNDTMDRVGGWYKREAQFSAAMLAIAITFLVNADTIQIVRTLWTNPTLRAKLIEQAKARSEKPLTVDYTDAEQPEQSTIVDHPEADDSSRLTAQESEALGELVSWSEEFRQLHRRAAIEKEGEKGKNCLKAREKKTISATCPGTAPSAQASAAQPAPPGADCECKDVLARIDRAAQDASFPGSGALTSGAFGGWLAWAFGQHFWGWVLTAIAVSLGAPFWFDVLQKFMQLRSAGKVPEPKKPQAEQPATAGAK